MLDAEYMPPAGHGDVLRAALRRPRVIAIVDGVFERTPAVWQHKEILFALSEGIHVYGAASMGALRAAELDRFGMRGVGDVYRAYAEGMLEDDDEVAVAHTDAEHGFRALSDSMVDVRATLEKAADRVVEERTAAGSWRVSRRRSTRNACSSLPSIARTWSTSVCAPGFRRAGCDASVKTRSLCCEPSSATSRRASSRSGPRGPCSAPATGRTRAARWS